MPSPTSHTSYVFGGLVAIAIFAGGCDSGTPSVALARQAFAAQIDSGSAERLKIRDFKKTDGQQAELAGIAVYRMDFSAVVDVASPVLVTSGGGWSKTNVRSRPIFVSDTSSAFSWNQYFARSFNGGRPLFAGDQLLLKGTVEFERKESGWNSGDVEFETTVDSSRRVANNSEAPITQMAGMEPAARLDRFAGLWQNKEGRCVEITRGDKVGAYAVRMFPCGARKQGEVWDGILDGATAPDVLHLSRSQFSFTWKAEDEIWLDESSEDPDFVLPLHPQYRRIRK